MNKSRYTLSGALVAVSAALLISGSVALAAVQAGTAGDSLMTKSYVEDTYRNQVNAKAAALAGEKLGAAQTAVTTALSTAEAAYSDSEIGAVLARQVAIAMGAVPQETASFAAGATISAPFGTELCLTAGAVSLSAGRLLSLTTGKAVPVGGTLMQNHVYLSVERSATLRVAAAAKLRVRGSYTSDGAAPGGYVVQYTAYAAALEELGLFSGSNIGYELERASTRAEGLVMLLRLLGKEQQARVYTGTHPFKDVPAWASRYVAYAYQEGYASGMSATEYGAQINLTLNDYMTFLLRALGYNDSKGDFSWRTAADTATSYGILTEAHKHQITARGVFYRDDIVYTSYQTLFLRMKGRMDRLSDSLLAQDVFTQADLDRAFKKIP